MGGDGLARVFRIAREWWGLILAATVAGLLVSAFVATNRGKTYQAEAILSVSPVTQNETQYRGLSVLRDTGEASRDVETLSRLVQTLPVATEAARLAEVSGDPSALLDRVDSNPIGGSSLVSVLAQADSAAASAQLANAFASATSNVLDQRLQTQATAIAERLRAQIGSGQLVGSSLELVNNRLGELDAVRAGGDPTVSIETVASPPGSATSAGSVALGLLGAIVGLIIGLGVALVVERRTPRIRSSWHVEDRLGLPVLATVTAAARGDGVTGFGGNTILALGATLVQAGREERKRAVGVIGLRDLDGGATLVRDLARTMAQAGHDVLLANFSARPNENGGHGRQPTDILEDESAQTTALDGDVPRTITLPLPGTSGSTGPGGRSIAARLVSTGQQRADLVLVDVPSLEHGPTSLRIARAADRVVLVAHRQSAKLPELRSAINLLSSSAVEVIGIVLIDVQGARSADSAPNSAPRRRDRPQRPKPVRDRISVD